ncbi:antigen WC1.1-like [Seriola lalandi dorsalis]|uniref:antigen WC1.1-like n=1 Tax=Seriola lalandi dorsalis TaxID=1841481 RepID=UPI000C6F8195|nr:antigen WC1.1-like [Seriola lalandi dorsalis]
MARLLMVLLLLWSSGLRAEGNHQSPGAQCESTAKTDIVLLVDDSGSIRNDDFASMLVFLADVVRRFDIGPDKFQIGVTLYSDSPKTMWNLNTYQNKESLLSAIANLKQTGGGTMIGRALDRINQMSFKPHVGMRADSRKIAVLITDGKSQDAVNLPSQNLKDRGIEIYTIGVRDADRSQLWSIASDPKESHMYHIQEFLSFSDITNNLYIDLCNSTKSLDSVRLVNGTSLCSGRLEVKSNQFNQSNQWWSSVCDADFDQQDAEVVCRELGCGAPSVLQGALYGEVEAPMWTREFQCGGNESALRDCRSSDSARTTCSPWKAVGLTCSEPVRLVGEASRCAGTLQVNRGEWRPVDDDGWTLKEAAVACRELDCGSAVSTRRGMESSYSSVWKINTDCVHSGFTLRDCSSSASPSAILEITCSDLLVQPIISVSSSMDGVSEAQQQGNLSVFMGSDFSISCSIQPQYPGGFFQLTFTSPGTTHNYNQPAVNHSAHFLFPAAQPAHQGNYSCVYHIYVFSHNFSSESRQLSFTVSDPTGTIIRLVVLPLSLLLVIAVICFILKATRGQKPVPQETKELDCYNLGVSRAEGGPAEEEGVQAAE